MFIACDYDGVIVDSLECYAHAFCTACEKCGVFLARSTADFLKLFEENLFLSMRAEGLLDSQIDTIFKQMEKEMHAAPNIRPFEQMRAVLAEAENNNVHKLVIVTSNDSAYVREEWQEFSLPGLPEVLGSDYEESKSVKLARCKERAAAAGQNLCYIADTIGDILEARAVGVEVWAVSWGWHNLDRLISAGADKSCHSGEELLSLLTQ